MGSLHLICPILLSHSSPNGGRVRATLAGLLNTTTSSELVSIPQCSLGTPDQSSDVALDGGTQVMVFILSFAVQGAGGTSHPFPTWWGAEKEVITTTVSC